MTKKHHDLIIIASVVLCIVMYDVVIDLVFSMLHVVFEIIHIAYEWFELGIEHAVEHLFHTSRHGSQIVTFYILLLIAGLLIHRLWRLVPALFGKLKRFTHQTWKRRKSEWNAYWLSLTFMNKVKLLAKATGIVYLASFLVM